MKNILKLLILSSIVFVASCKTPEDIDIITVNEPEWSIGPEGGRLDIVVNSTSEWTVSKDAAWVTISKKSGEEGESNFTIRAGENMSGVERKAVITFVSTNSQTTVSITQARNLVLDFEASDYTVGAEGGVLNVNLKSNLDYSIKIVGGDGWISTDDTKGIVSSTHKFIVEKNPIKEGRSATVVFTDSKEKVEKTIVIYQRPLPDMIQLTYTGDSLTSPILKGQDVIASIEWGDNGKDSLYGSTPVSHVYEKEGTWNVKVSANYMESFIISSLEGISELDLSDFAPQE